MATEPQRPPAWEILLSDSYSYQMKANILGEDEAEAKFNALNMAQSWFPHHFWKIVETKRLN